MWKAVFKKFYLVHSSILCPIWTSIYKFIWIQVLNMIWIVFRKLGKTLILVRLLYKRICEEEHHVLPVTNCRNFGLFFCDLDCLSWTLTFHVTTWGGQWTILILLYQDRMLLNIEEMICTLLWDFHHVFLIAVYRIIRL